MILLSVQLQTQRISDQNKYEVKIMFKYVKIFIIIIVIVFIVLIGLFVYELGNLNIRQTKDYAIMYVDKTDVIDSDAMISPPEKYSQLLQIDINTRKKVAEYMNKNNYKLKSGKQEFIRNSPSIEELINDGFIFEKI